MEDLFSPGYSELRRSRIFTDLRGLWDEIDTGAPIGLLLSFSPEISAIGSNNGVEDGLKRGYDALYSRMANKIIRLPLLSNEHIVDFTTTWVKSLEGEKDFNTTLQPNPTELANTAWRTLQQERKLYPRNLVTPRDLLTALANEVERRARP